jgi:endonuclease/exonuclease/phosphatase family metal-dependent hydrolase
MAQLKMVQLNMLAPLWIGEIYKKLPCYSKVISPQRIINVITYLLEFKADVYVLCEVERDTATLISDHFGYEYDVTFTSNKNGFWSEYLEGKEWIENGTCIVVKNTKMEITNRSSIDLRDGCIATLVDAVYKGIDITIVSLHFDTGDRKYKEVTTLIEHMRHVHEYDISIISGDFNMTSVKEFTNEGYVSSNDLTNHHTTILHEGIIDHTLVKGAKHINSEILDASLDNTSTPIGVATRMCSNVSHSDHYATISTIVL